MQKLDYQRFSFVVKYEGINIFLVLFVFFLFSTATAQIPPAVITNGIDQIFHGHVNQSLGLLPGHFVCIEKSGTWVYSNAADFVSVSTKKIVME